MLPLKVGLVGCGRLAERGWMPALAEAGRGGGARLVAIAEPDAGRREAATRAAGLDASAVFADWRDLIAARCVDAVVLALDGRAQVEPAAAATQAGLAVLVEKPPGGDLAGATALAHLSPAPSVGFSRRFDPVWRELRSAAQGAPEPGALELRIAYRRSAWAPHTVSDDALADLGSHAADLTAWIGGGPVARARCAVLRPDAAEGELELAEGRGSARFAVAQGRPYAELGRLGGGGPTVRRGGPWRNALARLGAGPDASALVRSLTAELAAFAGRARGEDAGDLASAEDGVRCHAVLEALRASAARGAEWVGVTLAAEPR